MSDDHNDDNAAFAASILILLEKLASGERLVISKVGIDLHIRMEDIPAGAMRELNSRIKREGN